LLDAFIKRFGTTFFTELAKTRLDELKASAANTRPKSTSWPPLPKDGARERVVLFEEDPADPKGKSFEGVVIWHSETIKSKGNEGQLALRGDIEIQSRGLRMTMTLKPNLDASLPASHVVELTTAVSSEFAGGGIANIPGILMKTNEQARGTPMAGLAVKVTDGFFLVGLSNVAADRARNLKLLLERSWFDIPMVYANQRRAIVAIEKGGSGDQLFKTVITAWGPYPDATQPEAAAPDPSNHDMPEEWKRTMGSQKAH